MLSQLEIDHFQSLRKVALPLGRLTVVTGATGSGKSSLVRALQLVAFNARGTSYISHGATSCQVRLWDYPTSIADSVCYNIVRGTRGKDAYTVVRHKDQVAIDPDMVFTKLGGKVPDEVSALLRLSPLNFAGQFDRPFLLSDSAGEVARVLGELTNVTLIFSAAREANRRRLRLAGQLADAREELERLTRDVQRFAGLRARQAAASAAGEAWAAAQDTGYRVLALQQAMERLEAARATLRRAVVPDVPATTELEDILARRDRLRQLIATQIQAGSHRGQASASARNHQEDVSQAQEQLAALLAEAGVCPTCGQTIAKTERVSDHAEH